MQREMYQTLLKWKEKNGHKPLMLLGARQVGKTYIINQFCEENYKHVVHVNLFERVDVVELTGLFGYPIKEAKFVAYEAVLEVLAQYKTDITVIFDVFSQEDYDEYYELFQSQKVDL